MNVDFVLSQIRKRLEEEAREADEQVLTVVREELLRERQRLAPGGTVQWERERRLEAETLRDVLEAITRQARLEDTIGEVLRQLEKLVAFDACSIGLLENGRLRIIAVRGFPDEAAVLGLTFETPLVAALQGSHWPIALEDAQQDERFVQVENMPVVRSWVGLPLLVEGEVIGLLSLDRHRVEPFGEEDLHRARAVAFSAAAAIRKAQLLKQVQRYATLMEQVVAVDHAVFAAKPPEDVRRQMLQGALRVGNYPQGLLLLETDGQLAVSDAAGQDGLEPLVGRQAPEALRTRTLMRLQPAQATELGRSSGLELPAQTLLVVPLATAESYFGCLLLVDEDGESPDDRLMEAYASRVATAYRHALRH